MSTKPATRRRDSPFIAILLFPLRAVERTHGWRRLGLLLVYLMIALPVLAMLYRRSQLAGLPDVGEIYGGMVTATPAKAPDDRNAFVLYHRATERFRDMTNAEGDSFSNANFHWSHADAVFRRWVVEHRPAIALLRSASERPDAYFDKRGFPPGPLGFVASTEIIRLSWIGTAALFEADRLRLDGNVAGAWALLKSAVRASRDMERAMPTSWCRGTAMTQVQYAREPVSAWAKDSSVSVELLKRALDDLSAAEALTPPLSSFYRGEYLAAEESLANIDSLVAERTKARAAAGASDPLAFAPRLDAFLRGEPDRTRRVLRLLAANDLAWCDHSPEARPELAVPRLRIYQPDPIAPPASRALSPEDLARWADTILINPALPWRMGELEQYERSDRWSLGQLKEAVAVPLFTREMGRRPASPVEALLRYFPIQGNSPERDEAEPVPAQSGK
jgi:hypothetical protein